MPDDRKLHLPRALGRSDRWQPLLAFLGIMALTLLLAKGAERLDHERLRLETEVTAEQVHLRLEAWMDSRVAVVRYLVEDWTEDHGADPRDFRAEARRILDQYSGFQAINWIDADWVIRIIVPEAGNEPALDRDLHAHPEPDVVLAIARAQQSGSISRTSAIELLQGGMGFATYLPRSDERGKLLGFMNGVFRIDTLIDACLAEESLRRRFRFSLRESDGEQVYAHGMESAASFPSQVELPVQIVDRPWLLQFAPSEAMLSGSASFAGRVILAIGFSLALVVGWVVRLQLQRQEALAENQAQLTAILANAPVMMVLVGAERRVRHINPSRRANGSRLGVESAAGERMFAELLACLETLAETGGCGAGQACEHCALRNCILATLGDGSSHHRVPGTHPSPAGDGKEIHFLVSSSPVRIAGETLALVYLEDITELRRSEQHRRALEKQMQSAQRLESLGVMAGGMAHDFNNILMAVLGNAELVKLGLSDDSPLARRIDEIEKASRRAADLCYQLLAYSGRRTMSRESLDLSMIASDMAQMLEISISKKISLKADYAPDLPLIRGDVTQVRQIILNLITNASEAIGDRGGSIAVSTGTMACDREMLRATYLDDDLAPGDYVYIEVSDTGAGMDEDTLRKIFEPFFTTKFTGRGLGLAAVLGIVRGHSGAIAVNSRPGEGTTFRVLFPIRSAGERALTGAPAPDVDSWRGEGTILLIDDEAAIREVDGLLLEQAGFTVVTAADGASGLEAFGARRSEIRGAVIDLTMPVMDGEETFRALRRLRAGLPVVMSSGYGEESVPESILEDGRTAFVRKPHGRRELLGALRRVLEAPGTGPGSA